MKRILCLWIVLGLLTGLVRILLPARAEASGQDGSAWVKYDYRSLDVGNPTPMEGRFFTSLWGGTTSDLDAQQLLHGYSLVKWDEELGRVRFDRSVVSGGVTVDDAEGNRTYILTLQKDLRYSDGTQIMAWDYAFGLLLSCNPIIPELGGKQLDASWLVGYDEYAGRRSRTISGLRVLGNYELSITVKADALPCFYELNRLNLKPYPISALAPGHSVVDDGRGARISPDLEKEELEQSILDPESGYLSHPKVVSGPYVLKKFDGKKAEFERNPSYKGNEDGRKPILETLTFSQADPGRMIRDLGEGKLGLLNKVVREDLVEEGMSLIRRESRQYAMTNYLRSGLSLVRFNENSPRAQELAVRQAAAHCMDRETFVRQYIGPYGVIVDGYYGIGQWMYQIVDGNGAYDPATPVRTEEERLDRERQKAEIRELNLEGLTRYAFDPEKAGEILDEAGWTLDMGGASYVPGRGDIRYKVVDSSLLRLRLTMAVPGSPELMRILRETFVPAFKEAGIELILQASDMKTLQDLYSGQGEGIDMVFLGENFSESFDPEVFRPAGDSEIARTDAELYGLSREMIRTDPEDVAGFLTKWVALQERISETLPLIPIYSNMYFDFYTSELRGYSVQAASWADAILTAYMGYPDE